MTPWIVAENHVQSIPGFESAVNNRLNALLSMELPEGQQFLSINVWVNWAGSYDEAGTYQVTTTLYWEYQVEMAVYEFHYPVPIWDADSYAEWLSTWRTDPSRTFYGVFPEFTQERWGAIFMQIGITGETWTKDMRDFFFLPGELPILY